MNRLGNMTIKLLGGHTAGEFEAMRASKNAHRALAQGEKFQAANLKARREAEERAKRERERAIQCCEPWLKAGRGGISEDHFGDRPLRRDLILGDVVEAAVRFCPWCGDRKPLYRLDHRPGSPS